MCLQENSWEKPGVNSILGRASYVSELAIDSEIVPVKYERFVRRSRGQT